MSNFKICKKCPINKKDITFDNIIKLAQKNIGNYYDDIDITYNSETKIIIIEGDLKDDFERAITQAMVIINIENEQLCYEAEGEVSVGRWTYVWFCLGYLYPSFFVILCINLILFLISKDKPQHYFNEIFEAMKYELE